MKTNFDIEELIAAGRITSELDYERAMVADRKLRLLGKTSMYFKGLRLKLRNLIEEYEKTNWSDHKAVTKKRLRESERAEENAAAERLFIEKRKSKRASFFSLV